MIIDHEIVLWLVMRQLTQRLSLRAAKSMIQMISLPIPSTNIIFVRSMVLLYFPLAMVKTVHCVAHHYMSVKSVKFLINLLHQGSRLIEFGIGLREFLIPFYQAFLECWRCPWNSDGSFRRIVTSSLSGRQVCMGCPLQFQGFFFEEWGLYSTQFWDRKSG